LTRPLVVPVDLGGSPHVTPLHPPRRPPPTPDLVGALVHHYRTERQTPSHPSLEVGFFHGGVPHDSLLASAGGLPVRVACLPGDLTPADLSRLSAFHVGTVELDIGSMDTATRRSVGRRLTRSALTRLVCGLHDRQFRVGVVLSPGLPGASHESALADARWASTEVPVDFVRLQPALVWRGTAGQRWVQDGRWTPMTVGQAATTLEAMMDTLDASHVEIARVGLQPGPDISAKAVAGPIHPNLRALVEYRRFFSRMRTALELVPRSREAMLRVHPADLSWAKGQANANIRRLRVDLGLADLSVQPDESVARGTVDVGPLPVRSVG
jgi:hypothetical protein